MPERLASELQLKKLATLAIGAVTITEDVPLVGGRLEEVTDAGYLSSGLSLK